MSSREERRRFMARISKIDHSQQNVFGWAYVTHDRFGHINYDRSGDFVDDTEVIERAAYAFVTNSRSGDVDHNEDRVSTLIESVVFTPEKAAAMGLPINTVPAGWWVGFHVHDPSVWARVESGELRAFSIAGEWTATRA